MDPFKRMAEVITPGAQGVAVLDIMEVSEGLAKFSRIRAAAHPEELPVQVGTYARLTVKNVLMMTDTQMERQSNYLFIEKAHGHVLVAGLGIGMVVHALLEKKSVTSILVVEKYQDVIDLVSPQFAEALEEGRLTILCEDIEKFIPDDSWTWNTIYFDIWPDISVGNLPQMTRLHNQFRYFLEPEGWMDSWMRKEIEARVAKGLSFLGPSSDEEDDEDDEE